MPCRRSFAAGVSCSAVPGHRVQCEPPWFNVPGRRRQSSRLLSSFVEDRVGADVIMRCLETEPLLGACFAGETHRPARANRRIGEIMLQRELYERFLALHQRDGGFIMPN